MPFPSLWHRPILCRQQVPAIVLFKEVPRCHRRNFLHLLRHFQSRHSIQALTSRQIKSPWGHRTNTGHISKDLPPYIWFLAQNRTAVYSFWIFLLPRTTSAVLNFILSGWDTSPPDSFWSRQEQLFESWFRNPPWRRLSLRGPMYPVGTNIPCWMYPSGTNVPCGDQCTLRSPCTLRGPMYPAGTNVPCGDQSTLRGPMYPAGTNFPAGTNCVCLLRAIYREFPCGDHLCGILPMYSFSLTIIY
jgi:hypothetical protein